MEQKNSKNGGEDEFPWFVKIWKFYNLQYEQIEQN